MGNKSNAKGDDAVREASGSALVRQGDGGEIVEEGGVSGPIQPTSNTRLQRRLTRAHKLEDLKWKALDPEKYVPRALSLLLAIALGEDDDGNPVGADKLQLEALKDYLDMALGDLPSFTEKVLKDDFVASVFESAATAIRSAFGDLPDFEDRMRRCAMTFQQIVMSSGVMDT